MPGSASSKEPRDVVPGDVVDGRVVGAPRELRVGRRDLLLGAGSALAGAGLSRALAQGAGSGPDPAPAPAPRVAAPPGRPGSWAEVRAQFLAPEGVAHLDGFVLGLSPTVVREAVEAHRTHLDADGVAYLAEQEEAAEAGVREAAGAYLGVEPDSIALTDSTTMGLGLVLGGARLSEGDEVLTTRHDFYAAHEALRLNAARSGARVRVVELYKDAGSTSVDEVVERLLAAVTSRTRLVEVTWVHSSSGLRLPVRALAARLRDLNRARPPAERAVLVVDGVHGLGAVAERVADLGCDVFIAGTHKWLYGPRGTGIVWARREVWPRFAPTIPTFDPTAYEAWRRGRPPQALEWAAAMTPGGFHSFENRWALAEAFDFHSRLGRERVAARVRQLGTRLREALAETPGVILRSPRDGELASGLVCFDVEGRDARQVVAALRRRRVRMSVTPYRRQFVRAGAPLWVSEADIEAAARAVRALARG